MSPGSRPPDLFLELGAPKLVRQHRDRRFFDEIAGLISPLLAGGWSRRIISRMLPDLGAYIYETCNKKFQAFLGGDESTVMRSLVSWAWFRPTEGAWDQGARWYRCDVIGGTEQSEELRTLPETAKGLLGENSFKALGEIRGKWQSFDGKPVMVTYHPAALLRNPQWKRPTWEDVKLLRTRYDQLV